MHTDRAAAPSSGTPPLMYTELAEWWPLLSAPDDYTEEAALYSRLLEAACDGPIASLLELGCGGGNNACHMKSRFDRLVLTDVAPGMLAVSRALNPDCEHHLGDMRTLRLNRVFDAVFIHDAVSYMATEADLRQAMKTAWVHCRPGAAVLFAPDDLIENFRPSSDSGGHDEVLPDGAPGCPRGLRYLEWDWDPDPHDGIYRSDYAYLLRERDGTVRVVHDHHVGGLFSRARWLALLGTVGFTEARCVPLVHSEVEPGRHEMFVARRPRS